MFIFLQVDSIEFEIIVIIDLIELLSCIVCESIMRRVWICIQCGFNFCDDCWGKECFYKFCVMGIGGCFYEKVNFGCG